MYYILHLTEQQFGVKEEATQGNFAQALPYTGRVLLKQSSHFQRGNEKSFLL
jgi:hypothetical protein